MTLTNKQKNQIIEKYKSEWTIEQIANEMKISKSTIHFWIKRYKLTGTLRRKPGTGIKIIDKNKDE